MPEGCRFPGPGLASLSGPTRHTLPAPRAADWGQKDVSGWEIVFLLSNAPLGTRPSRDGWRGCALGLSWEHCAPAGAQSITGRTFKRNHNEVPRCARAENSPRPPRLGEEQRGRESSVNGGGAGWCQHQWGAVVTEVPPGAPRLATKESPISMDQGRDHPHNQVAAWAMRVGPVTWAPALVTFHLLLWVMLPGESGLRVGEDTPPAGWRGCSPIPPGLPAGALRGQAPWLVVPMAGVPQAPTVYKAQ